MKKIFKKFSLARYTYIMSILICLICIGIYFCMLNIENSIDIRTVINDGLYSEKEIDILLGRIEICKEILLIIISILGTTIVTTPLIEINNQNDMYGTFIANDVFASQEFYLSLSDENKHKILSNLENNLYFQQSEIRQKMFSDIRNRINDPTMPFYYEECEVVLDCKMEKNYVVKEIVRKFIIKSFNEYCQISDMEILRYALEVRNGIDTFELNEVIIDDKEIDISKHIKIEKDIPSHNLFVKNRYNALYRVVYKPKIRFTKEKGTTIIVKYKSINFYDDMSVSLRTNAACNFFSIKCVVPEEYRIISHAFGFLESAENTLNSTLDNSVNISFTHWSFKENGVVLIFYRKE